MSEVCCSELLMQWNPASVINTYIHNEPAGRVDGKIVRSGQISRGKRKDESNTKIRVKREKHWERKG